MREGEGRMRGCPRSKTDPALFMSITKFSPQNSVHNPIHLPGKAVLGKGDIFGSNSRDASDASLRKLIIIWPRTFNSQFSSFYFPKFKKQGRYGDKIRIKGLTFSLFKVSSSVM